MAMPPTTAASPDDTPNDETSGVDTPQPIVYELTDNGDGTWSVSRESGSQSDAEDAGTAAPEGSPGDMLQDQGKSFPTLEKAVAALYTMAQDGGANGAGGGQANAFNAAFSGPSGP